MGVWECVRVMCVKLPFLGVFEGTPTGKPLFVGSCLFCCFSWGGGGGGRVPEKKMHPFVNQQSSYELTQLGLGAAQRRICSRSSLLPPAGQQRPRPHPRRRRPHHLSSPARSNQSCEVFVAPGGRGHPSEAAGPMPHPVSSSIPEFVS